MRSDTTPTAVVQNHRNPVIRLFSSIWFGIALLALILIYSSIVSALPPVRWALELTEMQAFRHWFFITLVALFVLVLATTTFLRTRWSPVHAGAVTAHLGLLLLTAGAIAYFSTKIEGDVLLQAPAILVRASVGSSSGTIGRFYAGPGSTWSRMLPSLGVPIHIKVLETKPRGVQPVAAAKISVQAADSPPRLIDLTDQPDDWKPVAETLSVSLAAYPPQNCFYDDETPVLYIRNRAAGTEVVRAINRLPIHRERYLPEGGVLRDARGTEIPSKRIRPEVVLFGLKIPTGWFEPWRVPIDVDAEGLPFTIRVTGYAPYVAALQPKLSPSGDMQVEPVLEVHEKRRADVSPRSMSAIRLKISGRGEHAGRSESRWCLFSSYPDVDVRPIEVQVPGTDTIWELVYSRARHDLGATLAARELSVTYFPGQRGVESFRSEVEVQQGSAPPQGATVATNQTFTVGPWTLFQSGFDGQERWSYTVLGVGNRRGMWAMNLGWIIVTLGCLYAFYVKPVLLRRMKAGV